MRGLEDADGNDQVRYPRSRRWLQFYVDLFLANCPKYCKGVKLTVISDPTRSDGCNWRLSAQAPEGGDGQEHLCLKVIENDLRLLFSVFDLAADDGDDEDDLGLQRA